MVPTLFQIQNWRIFQGPFDDLSIYSCKMLRPHIFKHISAYFSIYQRISAYFSIYHINYILLYILYIYIIYQHILSLCISAYLSTNDISLTLILTPTTLKYFHINHGDQSVFQLEIIINFLVSSFRYIWILVSVIGLRPVQFFYSYDFRYQNLMSVDVRFWCLKTVPALEGLYKFVVGTHIIIIIQYVEYHLKLK